MKYYIIAGGTFVDVAPHFSLASRAFGKVGLDLASALRKALGERGYLEDVHLIPTRMALGWAERSARDLPVLEAAGLSDLVTNEDLEKLLTHLAADPETKGIVLPAAVCDLEPVELSPAVGGSLAFGKDTYPRLSSANEYTLKTRPTRKVASIVRAVRKDVFLALFKATAGENATTQYTIGLSLLKKRSANLVFANDLRTHLNMVITPEQARYHETTDRADAVTGFAEMIALRSHLRFTRSTVVPGVAVPWHSDEIPASLRAVVDHCISRGAYKAFLGSTVGHFAVRGKKGDILTSRRKTDFNQLDKLGLVRIVAKDDDSVIAHGFKPSVGGQSQRIIFSEHPDMDCIVHFHCPTKVDSAVPLRSQRAYECGSHECGQNTSDGLKPFGEVLAVMLDKHGPNIVFNRATDPNVVIDFIEHNFDLTGRTDGEVNLAALQ